MIYAVIVLAILVAVLVIDAVLCRLRMTAVDRRIGDVEEKCRDLEGKLDPVYKPDEMLDAVDEATMFRLDRELNYDEDESNG